MFTLVSSKYVPLYHNIIKYHPRTFWQWLMNKEPDIESIYKRHNGCRFEDEHFSTMLEIFEQIVERFQKGYSRTVCTDDPAMKYLYIDKGRNTLTIQCSAWGQDNAKEKLNKLAKMCDGLLPECEINGRKFKININIVDSEAHSLLNKQRNTGG